MAEHADHDLLLVAAFAAGDLEADELAGAGALVAACGDCATLATDLRAIAHATSELPAPRRPRDFFVGPEDARRLRPQGLRRFVAAIRGPRRIQLARPLAGGLMMAGLAGLLVASLPGVSQRAAGAPSDQRLEFQANPTPGSDIQGGEPRAVGASGPPQASGGDVLSGVGQEASPPADAGRPGSAPTLGPDAIKTPRETPEGPSVLVMGSLALVAVGAALFLASMLRTEPRRS